MNKYENEIRFENEVVRWKCNGQIPPVHVLNEMVALGIITKERKEASEFVSKVEQDDFFRKCIRYRQKHGYTNEERLMIKGA